MGTLSSSRLSVVPEGEGEIMAMSAANSEAAAVEELF